VCSEVLCLSGPSESVFTLIFAVRMGTSPLPEMCFTIASILYNCNITASGCVDFIPGIIEPTATPVGLLHYSSWLCSSEVLSCFIKLFSLEGVPSGECNCLAELVRPSALSWSTHKLVPARQLMISSHRHCAAGFVLFSLSSELKNIISELLSQQLEKFYIIS
jgi:hypothetical protein